MDQRRYLVRRFLRIYPPYLICLAIFVLLRFATHTNVPTLGNIAARATLVFNYFDRYDYFSINPVFWSLAIELQFYIFLPVAVWLCVKTVPDEGRDLWFAGLFIILGLCSRAYEVNWMNHDHLAASAHIKLKWLTSHLDLFGAGMMLCVVERRWRMTRSLLTLWGG